MELMPLALALSLAKPGVIDTVPEAIREQVLTEAIAAITIQATAGLAAAINASLALAA